MDTPAHPPICVLGMHRSHTSMVTRMLYLFGADLAGAEHDLQSQVDNPEGYWEHWPIVRLNDELLKVLGGTWQSPPILHKGWSQDPSLSVFKVRIKGILAQFDPKRQWVFKDPRIMLTFEIWKDMIPDMKAVLCVRNPLEVAASLDARATEEKVPYEAALELWATYHRTLFESLQPEEALVTNSLAYSHDAGAEIHRLARIMDIPVSKAQLDDATATVRPDLFRSSISPVLLDRFETGNEVREIYWNLAANSGPVYEKATQNHALMQKLAEATLIRLHENTVLLRETQRWLQHEIRQVKQATTEITHLSSYVRQEISHVHMLRTALANNAVEISGLQKRLSEVQGDVEALRASKSYRIGKKLVDSLNAAAPPGSLQRRAAGRILRRRGAAPAPEVTPGSVPAGFSEVATAGLTLMLSEDPLVSIVIPVHNQWAFTSRCLTALKANLPGNIPVEIIVVNDGSVDETPARLNEIRGIRVVHHKSGSGFIAASNSGAAIAKGKYVLFLNNDTEVHPKWLDSLVETAEADDTVGAVGSMLIYPNGRLQEAGGIIYRDGSAANFGRDGDPSDTTVRYLREVDYCSGASLLVRKDKFDAYGGFDSHYSPAYYEDVDLCFKLRKDGLMVVFQPISKVTHFEGGTSGTDVTKGVKTYQVINHKKFCERWKTELQSHEHPNDHLFPYLASRRLTGKPTILFMDWVIPRPDKDAGSVRIDRIMRMCREFGYGVIFFSALAERFEPYASNLEALGIEVLTSNNEPDEGRGQLRHRLALADAVFVSRPPVMEKYLPLLLEENAAHIYYDTVDLHFVRIQRKSELGLKEQHDENWELLRQKELRFCRVAEVCLTVTDTDRDILVANGVPSVEVLPYIQDICREERPGFHEREGLVFIGGYLHAPNVDSAVWLVKEIMPLVWKHIPDLTVNLLGSNPSEEVLALQSDLVMVPGFKEDVEPDFLKGRVFVAPLRYGSGIKGKISQALYYRLPVVTTSIGAEGMGLERGKHALIAEDAESLAEAIVKLYKDKKLWQTLYDHSNEPLEFQSPEVVSWKIQSLFDRLKG